MSDDSLGLGVAEEAVAGSVLNQNVSVRKKSTIAAAVALSTPTISAAVRASCLDAADAAGVGMAGSIVAHHVHRPGLRGNEMSSTQLVVDARPERHDVGELAEQGTAEKQPEFARTGQQVTGIDSRIFEDAVAIHGRNDRLAEPGDHERRGEEPDDEQGERMYRGAEIGTS